MSDRTPTARTVRQIPGWAEYQRLQLERIRMEQRRDAAMFPSAIISGIGALMVATPIMFAPANDDSLWVALLVILTGLGAMVLGMVGIVAAMFRHWRKLP